MPMQGGGTERNAIVPFALYPGKFNGLCEVIAFKTHMDVKISYYLYPADKRNLI